MYYNEEEVRRFFKFLDPHASYFTCCLMDKKSGAPLKGYGTMYETVDTILATMSSLESLQPTLHTTLNATDDKGRKKQNITYTRVLCLDLDRPVELLEINNIKEQYRPHLIVRTSPCGETAFKYHIYWKIDGLPLEVWQHYQLGLAQQFKGDMSLDSVVKMIRVPGVSRVCKDDSIFNPEFVFARELQ